MTAVSASFLSATSVLALGLIVLAFAIYCLADVVSTETVRHLPKWLWVTISCCLVPLGGILYLIYGRPPTSGDTTPRQGCR